MTVKLIRMWSGEDVIADIVNETADVLVVTDPIVAVPSNQQGQIAFAPWSPLVKKDKLEIVMSYIVYIADPQDEIIEQYKTMTKSYTKLKHQVKSSRYYLFWGAATIAVMAGQIYVGNGYRKMLESVGDLTEMIEIKMEWDELRRDRGTGPYIPMREIIDPDDYIIWETTESNVNVN